MTLSLRYLTHRPRQRGPVGLHMEPSVTERVVQASCAHPNHTAQDMVGWHHRLNGHELGQSLGDSEGQGGLVCCKPWGHKESDTME